MAFLYHLKLRFRPLLQAVLRGLCQAGISAKTVTVAATLTSAAYGAWLALAPGSEWAWRLLPVFLLGRMALNALDGLLARASQPPAMPAASGSETGDRAADAAAIQAPTQLPVPNDNAIGYARPRRGLHFGLSAPNQKHRLLLRRLA